MLDHLQPVSYSKYLAFYQFYPAGLCKSLEVCNFNVLNRMLAWNTGLIWIRNITVTGCLSLSHWKKTSLYNSKPVLWCGHLLNYSTDFFFYFQSEKGLQVLPWWCQANGFGAWQEALGNDIFWKWQNLGRNKCMSSPLKKIPVEFQSRNTVCQETM